MLADFVALAELLPAFPMKGETDQRKLVEAIKRWLEQCKQRWVLIFDNADDVALVHDYLPQRGNGSILLTTRADAVGSLAISVEVETMGFVEGTHLLLRRAQRFEHASEEEINQAGNIVVALDHFPLALDQAGAYIDETHCSFVDYLDLYQNHRQALLVRRGTLATEYPNSVATTWLLSFQKVQRAYPAAAELLHLCAFLAPDRIPEELIRDGAAYWPPLLQQAATDLFAFNQMIAELLKFSLVKRLVETQTLSIHRLVQAVQMDMMEPEVQCQWAERVVRAVNEVFPDSPKDRAIWPQCLRYLDQVQACHRLLKDYGFSFIEAADLLHRTGFYLREHASYTIAEPLYQDALAIYEQQLGSTHPDLATNLTDQALLYQKQGNFAKAETLLKRALASRGPQWEETHPHLAIILITLAFLYQEQDNYTEAEPLLVRALVIREQQLGEIHPDTAKSLIDLALLYQKQGNFAKLEPLLDRILAIDEQQWGETDPDSTATSLVTLAFFCQEQGNYAKAESLLKRVIAIDEQQWGETHPDITNSLIALAFLYLKQGNYAKAEPLLERALAIREQQWGETHPDTAASLAALAFLYWKQGNYAKAEPLLKRALTIDESVLGREHPDTQTVHKDYASLLRTMKRDAKAKRLEENS